MNPALRRSLLIVLIAAATAIAILVAIASTTRSRVPQGSKVSARAPADRPILLLLTSLPLVFGEDFSLSESGSPALAMLETRYRVVPISVTDPAELSKGHILMMAHPLAQPAEDLVALDDWVRSGGRAILFADPLLEWPSRRPLGDPSRPPAIFLDTGLLAHWGLRLEGPARRGETIESLAGFDVLTVSPGQIFGRCEISRNRLVARCRIGKGQVTVVADADLLNVQQLGPRAAHNLEAVLSELAQLEQPSR